MVIERYRAGNPDAVGVRFKLRGRMLPDGVEYVASWMNEKGSLCYQVMEAPSLEALDPWIEQWEDLVDFEVVPLVGSTEFWSKRAGTEDESNSNPSSEATGS